MAVGANLRNMNEVWGFPAYNVDPETLGGIEDWSLWRGKPGTIIVNKHGERIGNESCPYDEFYRAFSTWDATAFEWRNIPSVIIVDATYAQHYPLPGTYVPNEVPPFVFQADTTEQIVERFEINAAALATTLQRFNENARQGRDPEFRRSEFHFDKFTNGDLTRTDIANPNLAPVETPPFYATPIWPGALSTNGGLQTNGNAQVLHVSGRVIPRLYATGNTMASAVGAGYAGGGATLGPGTTFAYLAGNHAAGLDPWE